METSQVAAFLIIGNIYEGKGFPADYEVPFSINSFQISGDKQLEKALSLME